MTDSYIEESGKLSPSSIIELFELELVEGLHYATGNPDNVITTYRWHAGTNSRLNESVKFNGQVYTPMPIEAEGFDYKSGKNDSLARPTLRISNLLSTISTILIEVNKITAGNDLLNAKVTRKRTFAMFLDSDNFDSTNPTADSTQKFPDEIYMIARKTLENREIVQFECASMFDMAGVRGPKRQILPDEFPGIGEFFQ